ncbi:hypothetical protein EYF80_006200 [Liparis tanakae]|uniref:Uncharacterized protein n=1 Tax=Liparis tanakae TaxID=230148 RepID=A0A4Z2J2G8_9TELE|nr:hypothetical protein EYF80_006200 [Liparis tanakae]
MHKMAKAAVTFLRSSESTDVPCDLSPAPRPTHGRDKRQLNSNTALNTWSTFSMPTQATPMSLSSSQTVSLVSYRQQQPVRFTNVTTSTMTGGASSRLIGFRHSASDESVTKVEIFQMCSAMRNYFLRLK